ncbi:MAG: class I tRNA ligase family protein [Hyphomicrobiales bacterium]
MVVERLLMKENKTDRRTMGREAFLQRVWAWKEESGGAITQQLRRLGASCDWSRERFTMDEGLSRAVLKVFVLQLYKEGPDLQGQAPGQLGSREAADRDLRSGSGAEGGVKGSLWHLRYPVDGTDEVIVVATTRPETMLGDTAVAVHPKNEKLKHLIGKFARLPLVGRLIPIVGDDYADPEKARARSRSRRLMTSMTSRWAGAMACRPSTSSTSSASSPCKSLISLLEFPPANASSMS